jgi:hypothetical protein
MRKLSLAAIVAALAAVWAFAARSPVNPALVQVKAVYILPMGSGLDQYLATQITRNGVFEVVTDPKKADAILTDRIGDSFEKRMEELYPPPKPPAPPEPEEAKDSKDATKDGEKKPKDKPKATAAQKAEAERLSQESSTPRTTTFGRNRGTLFLVDRTSRTVIWSLYNRAKDSRPATLDHTAARIVHQLQNDRLPPKPPSQ